MNGLRDKLPSAVAEHGSYPEEIFTTYYDVQWKRPTFSPKENVGRKVIGDIKV